MQIAPFVIAASLLFQLGDTPKIKVTTRLVQVSLVAHDKHGKPVRDLTKDDITLFDNGQKQKVRYMGLEAAEPDAATAPLAEGMVSNRFSNVVVNGKTQLTPLPTSLTVILIDALNTPQGYQHYSRDAVTAFLKQLQPGDRVAIFGLTTKLRLLHDFSTDPQALITSLARHATGDAKFDDFLDKGNTSLSVTGGNKAMEEDAQNPYAGPRNGSNPIPGAVGRASITRAALRKIALGLTGLSGRKNLIWLSGSFPVFNATIGFYGAIDDDEQAHSTWRALNDAALAVYPVDARGLLSAFDFRPDMSASAPQSERVRNNMAKAVDGNIERTQQTMRDVADATGGRAFLNETDIRRAIQGAMDDGRVSYTIAYTPAFETWDNTFHEIKIVVNRPEAQVRYRRGYLATSDTPSTDDAMERTAALREAMSNLLPATALSLQAKVIAPPAADDRHISVQLVIDAHEVVFDAGPDAKQQASLDLLIMTFDKSGKSMDQASQTLRLNVDPAKYASLLKQGIPLTAVVGAPEGAELVKLVVRDAASGVIGSLSLPIR